MSGNRIQHLWQKGNVGSINRASWFSIASFKDA